jgi:hypothetical protein
MPEPEQQSAFDFAPAFLPALAAPAFLPALDTDLLTLLPNLPHTRRTFLHNVRAHCLRRANDLEQIARYFTGLPAAPGFNLPAFVMCDEHRAQVRASAEQMRAEYADPLWMAQQLARWEMKAGPEDASAAQLAA